ncbi:MAG: DNA internalization-related competence protein ComEC/Rec2 [Magnetococcales bacterium]|nr:DNA internalization-related competence protein ComEC/Rec2 [Magnetococcales bacterium]
MGLFLLFQILGTVLLVHPAEPVRWPLAGALLVVAVGWTWNHRPGMAGVGMALAGLLLGLGAAGLDRMTPLPSGGELPREAVGEGILANREDRPDSVRLWVDQLIWPGLERPLTGLAQFNVYRHTVEARPGERIRLTFRPRPPESDRNPGGFDYAAWLDRQGVALVGTASRVETLESTGAWFWNRWRQEISDWIARTVPPEQRGLVEAMMVGKRGWLTLEETGRLQTAGIFHLIAISGFQLSLVAGWSYGLMRLLMACILPLSRRWNVKPAAAVLALPPLLTYAQLAGWSVSTQRAALMAALFLLAAASNRSYSPWRSLALALSGLLAWEPTQLFDAGFQLSFAAVAALFSLIPSSREAMGWRWWALVAVVPSLAAELVTAPLVAHHFHQIVPYGPLVNLVAVPWTSLLSIPLGLLALLSHPVFPSWGDALLSAMGWSMGVVDQVADWVQGLPHARWRVAGPPLGGVIGGAAMIALGAVMTRFSRRVRWGLALTALPLLGFWPHPQPAPEGWLHLAALNVGQAQAVALRSPSGFWSLVDAGGAVTPRYNVGESVISNYLWYYGATALERLVISHPQRDHMAGAERVLRNFAVGELWVGPFPDELEVPELARLTAAARERGTALRRLAAGETVVERDAAAGSPTRPVMTWRALHPAREDVELSLNNRSLVLAVEYGDHRFLLPGDAEKGAERAMAARGEPLRAVALLAPHHASQTSSSPEFVAAVRPSHVIVSTDGRSHPSLPHPKILQRWREAGAEIWRTDHEGAVALASDGRGWIVTLPAAGRHRREGRESTSLPEGAAGGGANAP